MFCSTQNYIAKFVACKRQNYITQSAKRKDDSCKQVASKAQKCKSSKSVFEDTKI